MKPQDQYLGFVAYRELSELVAREVEDLKRDGRDLPPPATRPMREAVPA